MTRLKIFMLGQSQITWDDEPLVISRRATRTLLFYLASQRKPVGRSLLCDLFWPDNSESEARNKLRGLIAKSRHSLPDPDLLITQNDYVSLDHSKIYVDQHDFTDQFAALRDVPWHYAEITPLPKPIVQSLVQALSLWKGPRFLGGAKLVSTINLDNWLMVYTEETLTSLRRLCLDRLASHYVTVGEPGAAVECLVTLKRYDEGNPILHHRLISALMQGGFLVEAKKSLDGSINYFEVKLGVPLPEQIVQDRETLQQLLNHDHSASSSPPWPKPPTLNLRLVGRQKELDAIFPMFSRGGCVILQGESGIGKTRLIKELYERSWPALQLFYTSSIESDQSLPFQTIINVLRANITEDQWKTLPNLWANFLTLLIPDLVLLKPGLIIPDRPSGTSGENLIYEAVLTLFKIVATRNRLVLVLDDAQYADVSSLSLVQFLVNHNFFQEHGVLVIVCQTMHNNIKLKSLIKQLSGLESTTTLTLEGLEEDEVGELVKQVETSSISSTLIRQLTEHTGGNPYLILETISTLRSESPSGSLGDVQYELPIGSNVQKLVTRRLALLPIESQTLINAAAVLGEIFEYQLLQRIADLPETQIEKAFCDLVQSEFIISESTKPGANPLFRFKHGMERLAILSTLPSYSVVNLHARVAHALQLTTAEQARPLASRVAVHYQAAGMLHEAIQWWLQAAQYSWTLFANSAAREAYQEVENIIQQNYALIPDGDIYDFSTQYALFAYESGDIEKLEQICQQALEWGEKRKYPSLIGAALLHMSYFSFVSGDYHEGLSFLNKAETYLAVSRHPQAMAELFVRRGLLLAMVNRHQEAIQSHNTALSINQSINEPSVLLTNFLAHYYKSNMLYAMGKFREGMNEIETGYERYRHILRPYHQIRAHLAFAYFHYQFGDLSELRRQSEQGYELARAMDSKVYELYFLSLLSSLENRLGNLDKSYAHIQEIITRSELLHHAELFLRGNYQLGEIFLLLNDFARAENAYRMGVAKPVNSYLYYQCHNRLVYALTFQGKINEAEKILHVIMDHELLTEMHGVYLESMLNQVNINFIKGKKEAASYIIEDLVEGAQKEGMAELLMLAKFAQMQVAADSGQHDLVDALHHEISAWSQEARVPWPHFTTIPFWMQFTKKPAEEKEKQLAISRRWIAQLEPNCQSAALHESFIAAKSLWLPIVD